MILGLIQLAAGFSLFAGNAYGRSIGIIGAALGALEALLAVGGQYPFWSLGVFALCLWILHGLVIYGKDEKAARPIPDGASPRSVRVCARVAADPGWWSGRRCVSPLLGIERSKAVQGQSETGDPLEQPVEVRGVDDRACDVRPAVVRGERHSVESGRVTRPELSLDDEAVATR